MYSKLVITIAALAIGATASAVGAKDVRERGRETEQRPDKLIEGMSKGAQGNWTAGKTITETGRSQQEAAERIRAAEVAAKSEKIDFSRLVDSTRLTDQERQAVDALNRAADDASIVSTGKLQQIAEQLKNGRTLEEAVKEVLKVDLETLIKNCK